MLVKELFAAFGLDVDAASFAEAIVAVDGLEGVLELVGEGIKKVAETFSEMISTTVETGAMFHDLALRTGVNVELLEKYAYVAGLAGVGTDELAMAFNRLAKKGVKDIPKAMGEISERVADLVAQGRGPEAAAYAISKFGKSGARLVPVLAKGKEEIAALAEEAEDLGSVMSEELVNKAKEVDDGFGRIRAAGKAVAFMFGEEMLPAIQESIEGFLMWFKANKEIIKQRVHQVAHAIGVALTFTWTVVKGLGSAVAWMVSKWKLFAILAAGILIPVLIAHNGIVLFAIQYYGYLGAAAVVAGIEAAAAWVAASWPLVLIGAAVVLLLLILEDLWTSFNGGEGILNGLMEKWTKFYDGLLTPNDDDPWWLLALKAVGTALADLQTSIPQAIDFWKVQLSAFWAWVVEGFKKVAHYATFGLAFGGGDNPAASAQNSTNQTSHVFSPSMRNNITIQQQPGQSGEELAGHTKNQLGDLMDQQMSHAGAALVGR